LNKTNIKTLIYILILFAIIVFVAVALSLKDNKNKTTINTNVVVDSDLVLKYNRGEWTNLYSIDDIAMEKFKVYRKNSYVGEYKITETNNKYYFFDDDYESIKIKSPYIAFSKKSNMAIKKYKKQEFDDNDYNIIDRYLRKIKVSYSGDYSVQEKYETNLNNNDTKDYIYILSNQLYSDEVFYIIFAKIDNKYVTINKQVNEEKINSYNLGWILSTSSSSYNDILLSETKFEAKEYSLYRYSRGEYKKVIPKV